MKKCCDVCGSSKNLHLGCFTLFDELDYICNDCLSKMSACEFGASYEELALEELKALNIEDDEEHRITVEENKVVVILYKDYDKITKVLVECSTEDEAIDTICELRSIL